MLGRTLLPRAALVGAALLLTALPASARGPNWVQRGDPPPSYFGWPLDDNRATYFGGASFRQYYSYGRGYGLADYNGPYTGSLDPGCYSGHLKGVGQPPSNANALMHPQPPVDLQEVPAAAFMEVEIPADAQVWVDGNVTSQQGTNRVFSSPPLEAGKSYSYEVRARWKKDGQDIEETQQISVQAGSRIQVKFPAEGGEKIPSPRPVLAR